MSPNDPLEIVPVGAAIALGLALIDLTNYVPCDGRSLTVAAYPELFAAIGTRYGGDGETSFGVPDYRGTFLRGAAHDTGVDPDVADRVSFSTDPVEPGDVGTYQDYATARPATHFTGNVPHLPTEYLGAHGMSNEPARDHGPKELDTCTAGGGDGDTAPRNVYVVYYLRARS